MMGGSSMLIQPRLGSLRPVDDAEEEIFHLFTNLKEQGRHGLGYATVHSDRILVQLDSTLVIANPHDQDGNARRPAVANGPSSRGHRSQALREQSVFHFPSGTVTISPAGGEGEDGDEDGGEVDVDPSSSAAAATTKRKTNALKKGGKGKVGVVSRSGKSTRGTAGSSSASAEGLVHEVVLRQDFTSFRSVVGNTGSVAWRASMALAALLINDLKLGASKRASQASLLNSPALFSDEDAKPRNWTVLEVGAGTGVLSSLVLTHPALRSLQQQHSSASTLRWIATDQGEVLELLRRNVENTNRRLARYDDPASATGPGAANGKVQLVARDLDWVEVLDLVRRGDERAQRRLQDLKRAVLASSSESTGEDDDKEVNDPDLILAIDCIFNPSLFPALLATLALFSTPRSRPSSSRSTSSSPPTQILIACELREVDMMRAFLEAWCGGSATYLGPERGGGGGGGEQRAGRSGPTLPAGGHHPGWVIHGWEADRREDDDGDGESDVVPPEGSSVGLGPGFAVWLATPCASV